MYEKETWRGVGGVACADYSSNGECQKEMSRFIEILWISLSLAFLLCVCVDVYLKLYGSNFFIKMFFMTTTSTE